MSNEHKVVCLSDSNVFLCTVSNTDGKWVAASEPIMFAVNGSSNDSSWVSLRDAAILVPNWHVSSPILIVTKLSDFTPDSVAGAAGMPGYASIWEVRLSFELTPVTPLTETVSVHVPGFGSCEMPTVKTTTDTGNIRLESPALYKHIVARSTCSLNIDGYAYPRSMFVVIGAGVFAPTDKTYELGLESDDVEAILEDLDISGASSIANDYFRDGSVKVRTPDVDSAPYFKIFTRHGINKGDIVSCYDIKTYSGLDDEGNPQYFGSSKAITQVAKPIVGDTVICVPLNHTDVGGEVVVEKYAISPVMLDARYGLNATTGISVVHGFYSTDSYMSVGRTDLRYLDNCSRHLIGEKLITAEASVTYGSPSGDGMDPKAILIASLGESAVYSSANNPNTPSTVSVLCLAETLNNLPCSFSLSLEVSAMSGYSLEYYFDDYDNYMDSKSAEFDFSLTDTRVAYYSPAASTKHVTADLYHDNLGDTYSVVGTGDAPIIVDYANLPTFVSRRMVNAAGYTGVVECGGKPRKPYDDYADDEYEEEDNKYFTFYDWVDDWHDPRSVKAYAGTDITITESTESSGLSAESERLLRSVDALDYVENALAVTAAVVPTHYASSEVNRNEDTRNSHSCGLSGVSISVSSGGSSDVKASVVDSSYSGKGSTTTDRTMVSNVWPSTSGTTSSSTSQITVAASNVLAGIPAEVVDNANYDIKASEALSGTFNTKITASTDSLSSSGLTVKLYKLTRNPDIYEYDGGLDGISIGGNDYSAPFGVDGVYGGVHRHSTGSFTLNAHCHALNESSGIPTSAAETLHIQSIPVVKPVYDENGRVKYENGSMVTETVNAQAICREISLDVFVCLEKRKTMPPPLKCEWNFECYVDDNGNFADYEDDHSSLATLYQFAYTGSVSDADNFKSCQPWDIPKYMGGSVLEDYEMRELRIQATQTATARWDDQNRSMVFTFKWNGKVYKRFKKLSKAREAIGTRKGYYIAYYINDDWDNPLYRIHNTTNTVSGDDVQEDQYTEEEMVANNADGYYHFDDVDDLDTIVDVDLEFNKCVDVANRYSSMATTIDYSYVNSVINQCVSDAKDAVEELYDLVENTLGDVPDEVRGDTPRDDWYDEWHSYAFEEWGAPVYGSNSHYLRHSFKSMSGSVQQIAGSSAVDEPVRAVQSVIEVTPHI